MNNTWAIAPPPLTSMRGMAACAVLNKGPRIVETVCFLVGIIDRMDEHYGKQRATLRRLTVADLVD